MLEIALKTGTKSLKQKAQEYNKALETAVKVEGYALRKDLKAEIRTGAPGGKQFAPLTFLARRKRGGKRFSPNKPLSRLALGVFYNIVKRSPFTMAIGWTGPKTSPAWRRIAERQQEGFSKSVTDPQESYFRHRGEEIGEKSQNRKFFFLKKSTHQLDTPARPIVDPFWQAHEMKALANIRTNFKRKLGGERI